MKRPHHLEKEEAVKRVYTWSPNGNGNDNRLGCVGFHVKKNVPSVPNPLKGSVFIMLYWVYVVLKSFLGMAGLAECESGPPINMEDPNLT